MRNLFYRSSNVRLKPLSRYWCRLHRMTWHSTIVYMICHSFSFFIRALCRASNLLGNMQVPNTRQNFPLFWWLYRSVEQLGRSCTIELIVQKLQVLLIWDQYTKKSQWCYFIQIRSTLNSTYVSLFREKLIVLVRYSLITLPMRSSYSVQYVKLDSSII